MNPHCLRESEIINVKNDSLKQWNIVWVTLLSGDKIVELYALFS